MYSYDEPVYMISVVAKILEIHPQTLRQYEREGLVEPGRTEGKMRLYSQRDIDRIKTILRLTREMGVNLAGVDIILRLKEEMENMEMEIGQIREELSRTRTESESVVPIGKSIVTKKSTYEIIVFKDE